MLDVIINIFNSIKDGDWSFTSIIEMLEAKLFSSYLRGPADQIVLTSDLIYHVFTILIPIAIMLMMIGFGISLTELAMDQQVTIDKIVKNFIFLIIAMIVLNNAVIKNEHGVFSVTERNGWLEKTYIYTTDICDELQKETFAATEENNKTIFNLKKLIGVEGVDEDKKGVALILDVIFNGIEALFELLASFLTMIIFAIFGLIASLFVFGVGIVRAVKLGIYMSLTPIAIAFYYNKSPMGMGYLKTLVALFMQEIVIILSLKMVFAIGTTSIDTVSATILMISLIGSILQSERKAKELIG